MWLFYLRSWGFWFEAVSLQIYAFWIRHNFESDADLLVIFHTSYLWLSTHLTCDCPHRIVWIEFEVQLSRILEREKRKTVLYSRPPCFSHQNDLQIGQNNYFSNNDADPFILAFRKRTQDDNLDEDPGEGAGVPGHTPMATWVFLTRVRFLITKPSGGRERTAMPSHDHENGNLTLMTYKRPLVAYSRLRVGYQRPLVAYSRPMSEECAGFTPETDCKVVWHLCV